MLSKHTERGRSNLSWQRVNLSTLQHRKVHIGYIGDLFRVNGLRQIGAAGLKNPQKSQNPKTQVSSLKEIVDWVVYETSDLTSFPCSEYIKENR